MCRFDADARWRRSVIAARFRACGKRSSSAAPAPATMSIRTLRRAFTTLSRCQVRRRSDPSSARPAKRGRGGARSCLRCASPMRVLIFSSICPSASTQVGEVEASTAKTGEAERRTRATLYTPVLQGIDTAGTVDPSALVTPVHDVESWDGASIALASQEFTDRLRRTSRARQTPGRHRVITIPSRKAVVVVQRNKRSIRHA